MFNRKQEKEGWEYKTNITSYFSIKSNIITPSNSQNRLICYDYQATYE